MKLTNIDNGSEFDFGRTSRDYAAYRDVYPEIMYDKLRELGIGTAGQRLLDLGSGTGVLALRFARAGATVTATDISENQIAEGRRLAAERGIANVSFRVCPAEDTGLDGGSFDAVTAAQCFHYFDAPRAAREIRRVLLPGGLFCKIFMDWLPYEDPVIAEMEALVLRYNPGWTGGGFKEYRFTVPEWTDGLFTVEAVENIDATLEFTKESWLGRIRSCRGVGAALSEAEVARFTDEYRRLLDKYPEPLRLKHQIHVELYKAV